MPLFSRPRSPAEIVRNLKEALNTLERGGDSKKQEKVRKDLISLAMIVTAAKRRRHSSPDEASATDGEATMIKQRNFVQV